MSAVSDSEHDLLTMLAEESIGRRIVPVVGSNWGRLFLPSLEETGKKPRAGLKILCIGSWTLGLLALEALLSLETQGPRAIHLVGLVTDDPLDTDARISVKRRFWRYYDESEREEYEWDILRRALSSGIPCYTGEIKCDAFHEILAQWNPEAIVVAAFGQVIDETIIAFPRYGIYNVHPSDLLHCHGAGPQPWEDIVERKAFSTRVTVHRVSPIIDNGCIVGQSPEINVRLPDGSLSGDVRMIGEKTLVPVGPMVRELALALVARKAAGTRGPLDSLDFERVFNARFKSRLLEPLDPARRGRLLPLPVGEQEYAV